MATTIGTTQIPSDEITIDAGSTVNIGFAFDRTTGFVGGMDTSNGSASPNTVQEVSNPTDAKNLFGDDSELHRAAKICFQSNVDTLYAVGVSETDDTYTSGNDETSGTLANSPVFDPNLHGDESITATDDSANDITVNIVYDDVPSQPSEADTINLNPHNGEWQADASDTYTIEYTYGDYDSGIDELLTESPRTVAVGTETASVGQRLADDGSATTTDLTDRAKGFNFAHGFIGADPVGDNEDTSSYASGYSDSIDEKRLSIAVSPRGYTDTNETEEARTVWGLAAQHAVATLGSSLTRNTLRGYESLRSDFSVDSLEILIDNNLLPLRDEPPVTIVKDETTSEEPAFGRVYGNQIADEATERIHLVSSQFIGNNFNTDESRRRLRRSYRNALLEIENASPPLLNAFSVNVSADATDDNQVDAEIGIDIVDVVDTVDVELAVGDVIVNQNP
jgi:hypothetical protein